MPYIITTYPQDQEPAVALEYGTGRRRAVATLGEAREWCELDVAARTDTFTGTYTVGAYGESDIPQSGGTIGPLPDGTVIEVARVSYDELRELMGQSSALWGDVQTIAAYNAQA